MKNLFQLLTLSLLLFIVSCEQSSDAEGTQKEATSTEEGNLENDVVLRIIEEDEVQEVMEFIVNEDFVLAYKDLREKRLNCKEDGSCESFRSWPDKRNFQPERKPAYQEEELAEVYAYCLLDKEGREKLLAEQSFKDKLEKLLYVLGGPEALAKICPER
jgi:hypothetical protein